MRVALVLGSGGARGYAHIGVIHALRARGHEVVGIAGSSMGALVGGLEAAGKLDEFAEWASALTQRAVLRLLDPSLASPGVLRAEKILDAVREILGDVLIEDLPVPFTSVATDLITGKSVWIQRGAVDGAIRASIAIPGLITPHVLDGRLLADGGILDPLPMAPVAAIHADVTIAVSVSGDDPEASRRHRESRPATTEWLNRMWRSSSSLLDTRAARTLLDTPTGRAVLGRFVAGDDEPLEEAARESVDGNSDGHGPSIPKLGSFEVMDRSIDIAQAALARHTLAAYPPDLLIELPRTVCRTLDFHRAAEVIEIGREFADAALQTLEASTSEV
ncbi:patatin-like phospholipase family protein [Mycobacterium sp. ITM-2016-00317]|uniref:patatin-like phospholipase family protein n=1 Tax=Mycobacterium sp. ITM-2016-00317 TaxID=2099694 RepID=UPI00287FC735|nr:patatin-like phospholipase family protein [Mycobacterium sp. ITM-2016-00317]WNG86436.1 patatin-like phospholipase family protein [Mycobacterium sp. ITM-2016-00317]